jgi:hypothetical protein
VGREKWDEARHGERGQQNNRFPLGSETVSAILLLSGKQRKTEHCIEVVARAGGLKGGERWGTVRYQWAQVSSSGLRTKALQTRFYQATAAQHISLLTRILASSAVSKYFSADNIAHSKRSSDFTHRPEASSIDTSLGRRASRFLAYFFFCVSIAEVSSKNITLPFAVFVLESKSLSRRNHEKQGLLNSPLKI